MGQRRILLLHNAQFHKNIIGSQGYSSSAVHCSQDGYRMAWPYIARDSLALENIQRMVIRRQVYGIIVIINAKHLHCKDCVMTMFGMVTRDTTCILTTRVFVVKADKSLVVVVSVGRRRRFAMSTVEVYTGDV